MTDKGKRLFREGITLILAMAVIAGIWCSGILGKQRTWGTMEYLNMTFISQDKKNPTYGIQNEGPKFDLPAGHYRLKFSVETDGSGEIRLASFNNAKITPDSFDFKAGDGEQIVEFDIEEGSKKFEVLVDFESGTYYKMGETRLYTPFYQDNAATLGIVILFVWLMAVLTERGILTPERRGILLILAGAVLVSSIPAFKENLSVYHDIKYHTARLRNLAEGLSEGMFPVRMGGYSYNGFGAITSVFYPDLFLYPFALLLNAGASLQYCIHLYAVSMNVLTAACMYLCAKRIFDSRQAGTLAAILYTLAPYRINGMWVRYAMGEFTAMAVIPIFILGLWEILWGDRNRWWVLSIGAALVFYSHLISTVLCALTACLLCALGIRSLLKEGRWMRLLLASFCTVGLCLMNILPMITYALGESTMTRFIRRRWREPRCRRRRSSCRGREN